MDQTLEKCIAFACAAHAGQTDKAGKPYIEHPLRVMHALSAPDEKIAGVLHDILEDTCYTCADLKQQLDLNDVLLHALTLLTREKDVPYMDYIRALADDPLARAVKIADLRDNMDLTRLSVVTDRDLARQEKYRQALRFLLMAERRAIP